MSIQSMPSMPGANPPPAVQNTAATALRAAAGISASAAIDQHAQTAPPQVASGNDTAQPNGQPLDAKDLASAIEKVQDFTKTVANELKFSIDDDSGQTVVKIVDTATDEVIRQIPSKEMLAIAQALGKIQGLLIRQKA